MYKIIEDLEFAVKQLQCGNNELMEKILVWNTGDLNLLDEFLLREISDILKKMTWCDLIVIKAGINRSDNLKKLSKLKIDSHKF